MLDFANPEWLSYFGQNVIRPIQLVDNYRALYSNSQVATYRRAYLRWMTQHLIEHDRGVHCRD